MIRVNVSIQTTRKRTHIPGLRYAATLPIYHWLQGGLRSLEDPITYLPGPFVSTSSSKALPENFRRFIYSLVDELNGIAFSVPHLALPQPSFLKMIMCRDCRNSCLPRFGAIIAPAIQDMFR